MVRKRGNEQIDRLNTNEKINIKNPETGIWQVTVSAMSLPAEGSQNFAIVITCGGYVGSAQIIQSEPIFDETLNMF